MPHAAKALILNDNAYVSPYLMRPLRRLDEVERSKPTADAAEADTKPAANDAKPRRRQSGADRRATPANGLERR